LNKAPGQVETKESNSGKKKGKNNKMEEKEEKA